jgi:hypothetical protein
VANKKRKCYAPSVAPRPCVVSFSDSTGVRHRVDVTADTLYEAAALGLKLLRDHGWASPIGPATRLEVRVSHPAITHEVTVLQLRKWSESTAVTPEERVRKDRVRTILA